MTHVLRFRKFADDISRLRKDSGISQEELAQKASINVHTISRIERDLSAPTIDTLKSIADVISEKTGTPVFLLLNSGI